jgi:hypothetical protein
MTSPKPGKLADDELLVCIESFGAGPPDFDVCREGAKLRAGHRLVRRYPQYFIPATASDDEVAAARELLYPHYQRLTR